MSDKQYFKNKDILVTGGCGSIGSALVRKLTEFDVKRIRVFDNDEFGLFKLDSELGDTNKIRILVGDVRDEKRLEMAIRDVDIVYHIAALKHVPLCEYNPYEAVETNVKGTQNVVDVARNAKVEKVIFVSTDKAVNPINTMGATKMLAEKLVLNAPLGNDKVIFSCVRFGNVLKTRGSFLPTLYDQIKSGQDITITSLDMVRFFMTIEKATELIFKATIVAKGREIFIFKMDAIRIIDLVDAMLLEFSPFPLDEARKRIKIVGKRVGEKISESLLTENELEYVYDSNDMLILNSPIHVPHFVNEKIIPSKISRAVYEANEANPLDTNELRRIVKVLFGTGGA